MSRMCSCRSCGMPSGGRGMLGLSRVGRQPCNSPYISNVLSIEDVTSAVVRWDTDDESTSVVRSGTARSSLRQSVASALPETSHSIELTGLAPGTRYYYEVESCNVDGFCATGATESFATLVLSNFLPADDASVFMSLPDRNFGSESKLDVDTDTVQWAYLKFNVEGISGNIRSAKIVLHNRGPSDAGGDIYSVPDTAWSESGITWNTRPPTEGPPIDSLGAVSEGTVYAFDVTPRVTGDGEYAFAILPTSPNSADYDSREASNPPVLQIRTEGTTTPTPQSLLRVSRWVLTGIAIVLSLLVLLRWFRHAAGS